MTGPKLPDDPADLFTPPSSVPPPFSDRDRVVEIARAQLETGDHTGLAYWTEVLPDWPEGSPHPRHWCGAMALACLRWAELCEWVWVPGKGFIYHDGDGNRLREPRLHITRFPEPGDIAYFQANQHYAIVESVDGDKLVTIDGNQSNRGAPPHKQRNPAILRRDDRKVRDVYAFFSIGGLCS